MFHAGSEPLPPPPPEAAAPLAGLVTEGPSASALSDSGDSSCSWVPTVRLAAVSSWSRGNDRGAIEKEG